MELTPINIAVNGKKCIGCQRNQRNQREIMLSFMEDKGTIHDIFLTTEQAQKLFQDLELELYRNSTAG